MTEETEKYLKEYESDFITAIWYSYTRQIPLSTLKEIDRIYTDAGNKPLNTNYSCSACVVKLMRQAGKMYFKEFPDRIPEDLRSRKI